MTGVKGNRRTLYSKMVIKESFIKLLQYNELHKITVTDICREADINRGTFYNYYSDPFNLLKSIEDDFFNIVIDYLSDNSKYKTTVSKLTKIFEFAIENKDLSKILISKLGDDEIFERILLITNENDINQIKKHINNNNKTYINYLTEFMIKGSVGIVESWIKNDFKESPTEIAQIINDILLKIEDMVGLI